MSPAGIDVICEQDIETPLDEVEETGTTFEENALIKAKAAVKALGMPAVADDSGLCADALDGAPGVYSARFSGEHGNDEKNNDKLLELLKDVPYERRTARYVCAVACAFPNGLSFTVRGLCEGHIAFERHGSGGFGYDPIFISEIGPFGETSAEAKDAISHRGRALRKLRDVLCAPKLVVFGGTFDPPHLGHTEMIEKTMQVTGAERALVIPTFIPPHKELSGGAGAEHRLNMCREAFGKIAGVEVSDMEIKRGGRSYTVDTLEELKRLYPGFMLILLCGGDMFGTLPGWRRYEDIIKLAMPLGFRRGGCDAADFDAAAVRLREDGAVTGSVDEIIVPVSSTEIRDAIANGESPEGLCGGVARYIEKNNLYRRGKAN